MHYLDLVVLVVAQREGLIFYNYLQQALSLPIYSSLIFLSKKPPTTLPIIWILKTEKTKLKELKINTKSNFSIYKHTSSNRKRK